MDPANLVILVFTTIIHVIGIGFFVLWLALGKPKSKADLRAWWTARFHRKR